MTLPIVSRQSQFETLLRRQGADLSHLRGPRGVVRCVLPGHDDRSASLSIDLAAAVFHCFGCGRGGGLKTLLELLGEGASTPARPRRRESPLQEARRAVMAREERVVAQRAEWAPWHFANGHIGRSGGAVHQARLLGTRLGEDDPRCWPLLERAAQVESDVFALEAELDEIAMGRLA